MVDVGCWSRAVFHLMQMFAHGGWNFVDKLLSEVHGPTKVIFHIQQFLHRYLHSVCILFPATDTPLIQLLNSRKISENIDISVFVCV